MGRLVLKYLGVDFLGTPVYEDENGLLLKDINCDSGEMSLYSVNGDIDGDPDTHISRLKRYQEICVGLEIVIVGRKDEPTPEEKSNYQLLDRLRSDCEYYLGFGNRSETRLWAHNVPSQILKMKELHDGFSYDKKPEWLTYEEILNYEKLMTA